MVNFENEELYAKFAPTRDDQFREIFIEWVKDFHDLYLSCDYNLNHDKGLKLQLELFHVNGNGFENSINPDISGNMIRSIIDSTDILKNQNVVETSKSSQGALKGK